MSTIASRIAEIMKEQHLSLRDLEEKTGIHRGTLSKYLSGKMEPKATPIHKIATALHVDEQWIMGLSDSRHLQSVANGPPWLSAPIYSCLSCGTGSWIEEQPIDRVGIPFHMAFTGKPFANYAQGDSMEPGIHEGDLLIFQETPEIQSGQIGSFSLNGEYFCKRFRRLPDGSCWLESDNPAYDPIPIGPDDSFRILGLYRIKMSKEQ